MLRRRDFLRTAGAFAAAGIVNRAAERKLNLLLIEASGWRANDPDLAAPNLKRLGNQGIQFDRAYSCCPLQLPSRAALLTGRFPYASGVRGEDGRLGLDQPSLGAELRKAGYRTGFAGPWRLDGTEEAADVSRHGFDYRSMALGIDFLKQKDSKPFFLFVALDGPRTAPIRSARVRDPNTLRLRPNVPEDLQAQAQAEYDVYYGLCSALDKAIGDLLGALDQQRLAGETIVVFTSDYGEMLGSQGLEGADVPFEEAVRVPLVIRHPGLSAAGRGSDFLVSNVDLMPTLLGFCGAELPDGVQGRDLSSLISTGQGNRPESIYSAGHLGYGDEWRLLVRGLDKLVVDRKLEVTHLYNLGQDPYELENHAEDPSQELKRDELKALLRDWMRRTGDGMDPSGLKKRA
jgi:arylsulfatase A-like enzyme